MQAAPALPSEARPARAVTLPLYAGIALVLIACLFLGRDVESDSFWVHLGAALIAPAIFYAVGLLVLRTGAAPIAGPGIVAAGAWLLGVALVLINDRYTLLSPWDRATPLAIAVTIATVAITLTAHRIWTPLFIPLVPIAQVTLLWAWLARVLIDTRWIAVISFGLVLIWWIAGGLLKERGPLYRLSAWVFTGVLCLIVLPAPTSWQGSAPGVWFWCVGVAVVGVMLLWTRHPLIVVQAGTVALACAWALLYDIAIADTGAFGVWMILFSSAALGIELILRRRAQAREKPKHKGSLTTALLNLPALDAVIAVNAVALVWTAQHVSTLPPLLAALTLLLAIGGWCAAGLAYRLPVLLHVALWLLPVPITLLLIQIAPGVWTVPLLGLAWQVMALIDLALGHTATRRLRPPMRAPFFTAGYGIVLIGMIVTLRDPALVPFSLGLTVAAYAVAGWLTALGRHPVWEVCAEWLIPSAQMPLLHRHVRSLFIWLAGLFGVVWVQLLLSSTALALPQQGAMLVLLSMGVLLIGRAVGRIPGVAASAIYGAGGLMWAIGLLLVLFTPAEAVLALLIGLSFSTEALHRTRSRVWLAVIAGNLALCGWQIVRLLPGGSAAFNPWVLVLAGGIGLVGTALIAETRGQAAARVVESVRAYWHTLR